MHRATPWRALASRVRRRSRHASASSSRSSPSLTVTAAVALALFAHPDGRPFSLPLLALAFVAGYLIVVARGVRRRRGEPSSPTLIVFVPMLLLLPTPLVPLLVVAAAPGHGAVGRCAANAAAERLCSRSTTRGSRSGPRSVLVALDAQLPAWASGRPTLAALAAQFAADSAARPLRAALVGHARARRARRVVPPSASTRCAPVGAAGRDRRRRCARRGPARAAARRPALRTSPASARPASRRRSSSAAPTAGPRCCCATCSRRTTSTPATTRTTSSSSPPASPTGSA